VKLSVDVQNPLAVSSDELSDEGPVVLDTRRRVDGPQHGRSSPDFELDVRRLGGGAGVEQSIGVARQSLDPQLTLRPQQRRRGGNLVRQNATVEQRRSVAVVVL